MTSRAMHRLGALASLLLGTVGFWTACHCDGAGIGGAVIDKSVMTELRDLHPGQIASAEIFRLGTSDTGRPTRESAARLAPAEVRAFEALLHRAESDGARASSGDGYCDFEMVVELKSGQQLRIPYNSVFEKPFGGLRSAELKEALHTLVRGETVLQAFVREKTKIVSQIHGALFDAVVPGHDGYRLQVDHAFNEEGSLTLRVQLFRGKDEKLVDDTRALRYDESTAFGNPESFSVWVKVYRPR